VIVRSLGTIRGTSRDVSAETWTSRRLLLAEDKLGFSLHDTVIRAGTTTRMWYQNHLEAVYCISGRGTVEVLETGGIFAISEGTLYALDRHDRHVLRAETEMRMICVFNPPLLGREVHDENGAYPAATDAEG
jgi:L-ectoine synthase